MRHLTEWNAPGCTGFDEMTHIVLLLLRFSGCCGGVERGSDAGLAVAAWWCGDGGGCGVGRGQVYCLRGKCMDGRVKAFAKQMGFCEVNNEEAKENCATAVVGYMVVSGLKSITSKHLALASQVISFMYAIVPGRMEYKLSNVVVESFLEVNVTDMALLLGFSCSVALNMIVTMVINMVLYQMVRAKTYCLDTTEIRRVLFRKVPETRKALLLSEIDRVAQDYKVHRDEIHTKLVQIMRERLLHHLRGLPQIVESWNNPEDYDTQASQFARSLTKEVGFLQRVLSRTLHEVDVQAIFRQVVVIFHSQISEAFSRLDISTPQAKNRLHRDIQQILGCIRSLPSDNLSKSSNQNWGQLDEFLVQRFGVEAGH
ncbi:hypothetical protein RJ639_042694 [Escallonia herrerae]|uniref:Vacuolar protein sorting-associated protein 54 C-terminal domain-containing protein n=1 Tax=Escallonia herrerae TaxID=1293975 RepID=A0AA88WGT1_9ASTE|nr:hypothetical protein RJ639_042694 [Escallonia herrerae]